MADNVVEGIRGWLQDRFTAPPNEAFPVLQSFLKGNYPENVFHPSLAVHVDKWRLCFPLVWVHDTCVAQELEVQNNELLPVALLERDPCVEQPDDAPLPLLDQLDGDGEAERSNTVGREDVAQK